MFRVLEICTANIASAVAAQMAGATRIELCSELAAGGVTPSVGVIEQVRSRIDIAINVLIRPRSGDFLYSSDEVESVLRDIAWCSKLGVQGVVVGALTPDAKVDVDASRQWLKEARSRGLSATFHRAIDCAENIFDATEVIASIGYDRILTSGGFPTAYEGIENIAKMVQMTSGKGPIIMPGSGVNPDNIREIITRTKAEEIHFSASSVYPSGMKVLGGIAKEETLTQSDPLKIRAAIEVLQAL